MKVYSELSLSSFNAWSGARSTLDRLIEEGACDTVEMALEELYPDGLSETELNDILWFEPEWVFELAGIEDEDEEEEE